MYFTLDNMQVESTVRIVASLATVLLLLLPGCFGENEEIVDGNDWAKGFAYIDDPAGFTGEDRVRPFNVSNPDPSLNETWGNSSWAVFGNAEGGNCCEHYLAATEWGWILNFGGEYPTWSEDRGHTWQEWMPPVVQDLNCRTPKLTLPGQEGLGEGSIVQTTTGDIIAMGWFPYPSASGGDQFYAFFWDADEEDWTWCFNRFTEPFYDRSWQMEIVGPIDANAPWGSGEWASLVISNFWHQSSNRGGQMSTDGLNYYYFEFPDRDAQLDTYEVDLTSMDLPVSWDYTKPHKEMRGFPVPSGGAYFPNFFSDGGDAFLDTSLSWWRATTLDGNSLPSEYCAFDSSSHLHCVLQTGTNFLHTVSDDGGETWANQTYNLSGVAEEIEEWEFHANGVHDLFVLNVRYQSSAGPDVDIAWHVRDYSEDLSPDSMTFIGLGDLDATSGAGQDIRFDFASMTILPDGGAVIAYHDASDPDPLFGLELFLPQEYSISQ